MTILQDGSTNGPGSIATNRDSATGQIMHSTIDQMDLNMVRWEME